jgi:hypothetical protein
LTIFKELKKDNLKFFKNKKYCDLIITNKSEEEEEDEEEILEGEGDVILKQENLNENIINEIEKQFIENENKNNFLIEEENLNTNVKKKFYEIKCSKSILCKLSYFKKCFSSGFEEEKKGIIRFPEISKSSMVFFFFFLIYLFIF